MYKLHKTTYVALPSYQGHHIPSTMQVLWEFSFHPETEKLNKNKKSPADKADDQTLAPKQSVQEGQLEKALLHGRRTTPNNKISGQDLKEMHIFNG